MISVIVPMYNEEKTVRELHRRINSVMTNIGEPYEIVFVDDGSTDGTFDEMKVLVPIKALRLRRNFGQSLAFSCGIHRAKGDIIVTLDGDLENQPEDIPLLINKLYEGYDVVTGWRTERWSTQRIVRRFPSLVANWLISRFSTVNIHDHGCSLRAYRSNVIRNVNLAGEMHRMLLAYIGNNGAKIAEIPIAFTPRKYGKSKYGFSRSLNVILDILAFYFFRWYSERPIHFFGYAGFASILLGSFTFLWALYLRIMEDIHFNRTPLPELMAIFIVVGFQFILMGLLGEVIVRLNREEQEDKNKSFEIIEYVQN